MVLSVLGMALCCMVARPGAAWQAPGVLPVTQHLLQEDTQNFSPAGVSPGNAPQPASGRQATASSSANVGFTDSDCAEPPFNPGDLAPCNVPIAAGPARVALVGAAPVLSVRLVLQGTGRVREGDQFTVQIVDQKKVIASATSQGSGIDVLAAGTGFVTVRSGVDYQFMDPMVAGSPSSPLDYSTQVVCTNRNRSGSAVEHINHITDTVRLYAGDRVDCRILKRAKAPQLTISTIGRGGNGTFQFRNLRNAEALNRFTDYTVQTAQEGLPADGRPLLLTRALVDTEIELLAQPGWTLLESYCVDRNAPFSGNASEWIVQQQGGNLIIPAALALPQAIFHCTFVNHFDGWSVEGRVILDNSLLQPHDGVRNAGEAGQEGVRLQLSDCAQHIYSQATSAADGSFRLLRNGADSGQRVCVQEQVPSGFQIVSRNVGSTQGVAEGEDTRFAFTLQADTHYVGVLFGNAPHSTWQTQDLKLLLPGGSVRHTLRYTAGSSGFLRVTAADLSTDLAPPWTHTVYLDAHCTGATVHLHNNALAVAPGETLCLVLEVASPSTALARTQQRMRITARERRDTPTLALPRRTQIFEFIQTSEIAERGNLNVRQEQRRLPRCPQDAGASLANPTPYGTVASVRPGEAMEYRFTYFNVSDVPLTQIEVYEVLPEYTAFSAAWCLHTPDRGLQSCAVELQPEVGAQRGAVRWRLQDASGTLRGLQAGDSGALSLCLYVQQ